ncbi:MAG TPA: ATP-binding protein [Actinophytocola sp.]|uniref:sensor histidine kinase n=1 Tax=Actinophytocola sp. TaxID=1872138 RepID=UPI002DBFC685|nr:ATP-binding protein [Actinophytocola sp.]HEU5475507.1 ATP-binding protein [Actinophytocola sp.]
MAVVLLLPALAALALGALRVKAQLDEADRLNTLRDQVTLLRESAELASRLADELVAASPVGRDREKVAAAVNEQLQQLQRADEATVLPESQDRILRDSYAGLDNARKLASSPDATPFNVVTSYYNLVNSMSALSSGIVAASGNQNLEGPGKAVEAMLRVRGLQGMDQVVLLLNAAGQPLDVGTGQRTTSEEAILAERIKRDIPQDKREAFENAVASAGERRQAFQAAIADPRKVSPAALLPKIKTEAEAVDGLLAQVLDGLNAQAGQLADDAQANALRDSAIVFGALLAALALALLVGRSLLGPVRVLRSAALDVAHQKLPNTVQRIRDGEEVDWRTVEPVPVHTGEEIGQLGRAFDEMHQQAVRLAGEQADLRRQVADMFTTLSRRSQSLVELQLETLERLEADEQDPKRLEDLFRLDHLATRLRRNGENLQVLSGGTPARRGQGAVSVVELLRASISEMNDYRRVNLGHAPNGEVRSPAAADVVHLLAELLENAARFSPPDKKVQFSADRAHDGGLLVKVIDAGIGMPPDELAEANERLAAGEDVGPETTRRMGLFVVSRLAERHGVKVRLRPTYESRSSQSGITAIVHIPPMHVALEAPAAPIRSGAFNGSTNGHAARPADDFPLRDWFQPMTDPTPPTMETARFRRTEPVAAQVTATPPPPAPPPPAPESWLNPPDREWRSSEAPRQDQPTRSGLPQRRSGGNGGQQLPAAPVSGLPARPPAEEPAPAGTTGSGLPMRRPGSRLTDGAVSREPAHALQRDPESIRNNLARHYTGVRNARTSRHASDSDAARTERSEGEA